MLRLGLAAGVFAVVGLAACAASPASPTPAERGSDPLERRTATADAIRLQSELFALTDTALARMTTATAAGLLHKDPDVRQFSHVTRLTLGSSLLAIVSGPDPVDALLDTLTHATLTADGARNEARGKAPDTPQSAVLRALELNEADAWRLAERWLNAPARDALRERIVGWPGDRGSAAGVGYVRLSDLPRTGSTSAVQVEGMIDSLRAAVRQAEQARLLGERSLFLAQRMPFALRWQAEIFAHNALTMDESRRMLEQISGLTAVAGTAVREVAGMPAQLSRERVAALQDLFAHIAQERRAMIEHLAEIVRQERSATLVEAGAVITEQRKAIVGDLIDVAGRAEHRGLQWAGVALVVGLVLVVVLLIGLLGMLLLYRRLAWRMEHKAAER